jgi:GcrA cell cycle regulator
MDWTDDAIQRLRVLWAEGHSAAEIGRRMEVSKNAIVGKAHRLDLPARPSPIRQCETGAPRATRSRRPPVPRLADMVLLRACGPLAMEPSRRAHPAPVPVVRPPVVRAPAVHSDPRPVVVERRLTGAVGMQPCCWPIGEPGKAGFRFCENLALVRRPYCAEHCDHAYKPMRQPADTALPQLS